ncbi:DUF1772 domain-containing protein [Nocardia bovistercoris]|uniref:DUF1772 domain-containing protein n=1 Tax=Nocardia bovistercoris TaxID=2785916 RepID=A0A931IHU8_9NOCA|nr:DUF1772 domain-containing protein [Nocardia bovistercoris]MBH0781709.1 DUF1772 domain-containing protein [Nocardia bovistercoris]
MLVTLGQILTGAAILANGVIYGTDACYALITRAVYARLDDATVTASAGWGHYYGDRRMPPIGVGGMITTAIAVIVAAISGHPGAAAAAGLALLALVAWLALYIRIAKPINTAQTAAARSGSTPPNARALQTRWDSIIHARVALQLAALAALVTTLTLF